MKSTNYIIHSYLCFLIKSTQNLMYFHKNRDILWTFCLEKYDEFLNGINHQHLNKEHIYLSLQRIYKTSMWMNSMFADK